MNNIKVFCLNAVNYNLGSDVMIRLATVDDLKDVYRIVVSSIETIYPKYYPAGAVDLYLYYHNSDNIENDIIENKVYIICDNGSVIGTVTISENDISRLYVDPDYQKHGYGTLLLDFAERIISEKYDRAVLDCSLPAKNLYLKRGYKEINFNSLKAENGDYLCYDTMEKILSQGWKIPPRCRGNVAIGNKRGRRS